MPNLFRNLFFEVLKRVQDDKLGVQLPLPYVTPHIPSAYSLPYVTPHLMRRPGKTICYIIDLDAVSSTANFRGMP